MADVGSARVEVEGDVSRFANQTASDLQAALDRMPTPKVEIEADVDKDRLGTAFNKAGVEAATTMTRGLSSGLSGLGSVLGSSPFLVTAGLAVAAGIAAAAAPALGGLLAAALISGGGLAAIAGAIALVADRPEIKKAATAIKDRFLDIDTSDLESQILAARDRLDKARKSKNKAAIDDARKDLKTLEDELSKAQAFNAKNFSLRDAAEPMIKPLLAALQTFVEAAKPIIASLGATFKSLADSGAIEALATGLVGLVTAALPGFNQLIDVAGPFLVMLADQLPIIGAALGVFFGSIASSAPGATVFFIDFIKWIGATIIMLGQLISWLANAYLSVRQFFVDAGAWIQGAIAWFTQFGATVAAVIAPLVPVFSAVWAAITATVRAAWAVIVVAVQTAVKVVQGVMAAVSAAIKGDWQGAWNAIRGIVSSVTGGIKGIISAFGANIRSVISSTVAAAKAVWSAAWSSMVSTVTSNVGKVRGIVNGLKNTVMGAFAGAASWLFSAGMKIISGLISGIQSKIGEVQSLLSRLTSMLPSWKGPARVDAQILKESGKLVMQGFQDGMSGEFGAIRRSLGALTGDLPGMSLPAGATRGGDGASAGGRGMTVHIAPGAIIIQGGGAGAGEEAAEALLRALSNAQG